MHTLRRNAQAGLGRIKAQDLVHGAKPAEVASYAQRTLGVTGAVVKLREFADQCLLGDGAGVPGGVKVERASVHVILFAAEIDPAPVSAVYAKQINPPIALCARKSAMNGGSLVYRHCSNISFR
jgi:hypothetical protein